MADSNVEGYKCKSEVTRRQRCTQYTELTRVISLWKQPAPFCQSLSVMEKEETYKKRITMTTQLKRVVFVVNCCLVGVGFCNILQPEDGQWTGQKWSSVPVTRPFRCVVHHWKASSMSTYVLPICYEKTKSLLSSPLTCKNFLVHFTFLLKPLASLVY